MAAHRSVRLNRQQALHERVMKAVVLRMQKTPYVFKGGSALAFLYGLNRHSTDIDFDGIEPVSIKHYVRDGLQDAQVSMSALLVAKDSWMGQRFKVHYIDPHNGADQLMRVDLSFRKEPDPHDIAVVDGVRTFKIGALFEQKLEAAADRTRARDIFDLGYVAKTFGDELHTEQIHKAERFSRDYEGLAGRFSSAFDADKLLKGLTTADDRVLEFRIAIIEQMHRRGLSVAEQSVPSARPLAEVLAHHKIWLGSDGREGSRADLGNRSFAGKILCGVDFEKADLQRTDFTGADLRHANLRDTDLRDAVFDGADLRGADFTGADVAGITIRKCMLGGTTKGLAEALVKIAQPDRSSSVRYRPLPRRPDRERQLGPSR